MWLRRGRSEHLCLDCCFSDPDPDKQQKMGDGTQTIQVVVFTLFDTGLTFTLLFPLPTYELE